MPEMGRLSFALHTHMAWANAFILALVIACRTSNAETRSITGFGSRLGKLKQAGTLSAHFRKREAVPTVCPLAAQKAAYPVGRLIAGMHLPMPQQVAGAARHSQVRGGGASFWPSCQQNKQDRSLQSSGSSKQSGAGVGGRLWLGGQEVQQGPGLEGIGYQARAASHTGHSKHGCGQLPGAGPPQPPASRGLLLLTLVPLVAHLAWQVRLQRARPRSDPGTPHTASARQLMPGSASWQADMCHGCAHSDDVPDLT